MGSSELFSNMVSTADSRSDQLLKDLASDYANYLITDTSTEWNNLEKVVKKLSTNLEDFSSLLESINLDTSLCVDNLLPQIASHFDQMKDTFEQIDTLESAVKTVEASVSSMELELGKAETPRRRVRFQNGFPTFSEIEQCARHTAGTPLSHSRRHLQVG